MRTTNSLCQPGHNLHLLSANRVAPMQLKLGDRLVDASGEYEIIGRPYVTTGGKDVHERMTVRRRREALGKGSASE